jgi:hypothetical protein
MAFTLPNRVDAAYDGQARLFSTDLLILSQPASLTGVKSGCAVTAQGSPDMTVAVASGVIYWLFSEVAVSSGNVTITAADATNPRIDLVVVNSSGVKSAVAGTPAAAPLEPALPALSVALAQVYVPATDTTIGSTQIYDRRIIVQVPSVAGASTLVVKTADESVTSSTALQNDDHLKLTMTSNGAWQVKFVLMMTQPSTNNSMKVNFTAPSGAIWRLASGSIRSVSDGPTTEMSFSISQSPTVNIVDGIVSTAATAGDFQLQWAQSSSDANTMKMLENSYLEYRLLA